VNDCYGFRSRWSGRRLPPLAVLPIITVAGLSCSTPERQDPPPQDRFELRADSGGRLIRLDKTTGQVSVVSGGPPRATTAPQKRPNNDEFASVGIPSAGASLPHDACTAVRAHERPFRLRVIGTEAKVFVAPRQLRVPVATFSAGATLVVDAVEGDWLLIRFVDPRWGDRVGYVHCSLVTPISREPATPPVRQSVAATPSTPAPIVVGRKSENAAESAPPPVPNVRPKKRIEDVHGYVEWIRDGHFIADGQRVAWNAHTRLKLGRLRDIDQVAVGYEINAKGYRTPDGTLLASELELKPNGTALYENEARRVSAELEDNYIRVGSMFEFDSRGMPFEIGRIVSSGADVDRVRRIVGKLAPPSLDIRSMRLYVVETQEWNAKAAGNGAIWVFSGLLESMSNDELAIVLGHELAHYTHEHMRRRFRTAMLVQLVSVAADAALTKAGDGTARAVLTEGARLGLSAWRNGYSRDLEDQADRVGLRYAYEGGYDVTQGTRVWERFRARYCEDDVVTNWFEGDHSRASDRIRNLEQQITLNYPRNR
jgi:Zn-dependent protease with chaperone function